MGVRNKKIKNRRKTQSITGKGKTASNRTV